MKTLKRYLLALLAVALVAAALVALWYAEENYRGARLWADTRQRLEVRGESLDPAHFIPPPVPDERNLAMAPFFARIYQYKVDPGTGLLTFGRNLSGAAYDSVTTLPYGEHKSGSPERPPRGTPFTRGQSLDLTAIQKYFRARDDFPHLGLPQSPAEETLLALTRYSGVLDEIAQAAATRPETRFPVNWTKRPAWVISLPHGSFIQATDDALRVRACASLELDRTDDALRDVLLGLRLQAGMEREPTLISHLVSVVSFYETLQPVWEGMAGRKWSSAQLVQIQAALEKFDALDGGLQAFRHERGSYMVSLREELRRPDGFKKLISMNNFDQSEGDEDRWLGRAGRLFPRGWADRSVAFACQWQQDHVIDAMDLKTRRVDPRMVEAGEGAVKNLPMTPTTFLTKFGGSFSSSVMLRFSRAQATRDQAVIACAMERYFLDHQTYPASLDLLTPGYLAEMPRDVVDGAPMHYQLTPGGRYRLWAVGWDGKDDGGQVAWKKDVRSPSLDDRQGDWVWQYEPLSPP